MGVPKRSDIAVGDKVGVETKADQGTGRLTEGTVEAILTGSEKPDPRAEPGAPGKPRRGRQTCQRRRSGCQHLHKSTVLFP